MADDDDDLSNILALVPPAGTRQGAAGQDTATEHLTGTRLVQMRAFGMTYEQIAAEAGYTDRSSARHAVLRAIDRHEAENVAELRALENAAYEADQRTIRAIISDPAADPLTRLRAIDTRTRSAARHARLNGLDAPQQIAITSPTQIELTQAMSEFREVVLGEVVIDADPDPD